MPRGGKQDPFEVARDSRRLIDVLNVKRHRIAAIAVAYIDVDGNIVFARAAASNSQYSVLKAGIQSAIDATTFGQGVK